MIKYVFCMTRPDHWFDVAEALYKQKIAEPVIWLGDDYHEEKAQETFGTEILSLLDCVHYPHEIKSKNIKIDDSGFYTSQNYLRAKDRCLKMMDRIDTYGQLTRIDREVYFNKLSLIFISIIETRRPTALVMAEAPHSHAQYLLYEICAYFGLKIAWFNNWMIGPIMNLQNMNTMELIPKKNIQSDVDIEQYFVLVDNYIENLNRKWLGEFEHDYMIAQRNSLKLYNKLNHFITVKLEAILRQSFRNMRYRIYRKYNPINPYRLSIITQMKIARLRRLNLARFHNIHAVNTLPDKKYVFFALHYEHERNTNPDGGIYHDQLIALLKLRSFLPKNITIVIKEHPTQIYHGERGPRGRSPLIYDILTQVEGVRLVRYDVDSVKIQKRAIFTASITGTAALESAINGQKAIIFGNAWFKGCPNIINFDDLESYTDFIKIPIETSDTIKTFFKNMMAKYCIPANQNRSAEIRNQKMTFKNFNKQQLTGLQDLMTTFLLGGAS